MTDRADPCWAAVAGLSPAVRVALAAPRPAIEPLSALLAADLPPFHLPAVSGTDHPPRELHALAASGGPDVCLVDCPAGTDRLGFAVAVAAEAVRRGERVAIVTGSASDADLLLARLLDSDLVVGRACGPDEPPDPDHGIDAHAVEAAALRRRLADHLDRRRADLHAARAATAALPQLAELADEMARLSQELDAVKLAPPAEPNAAVTPPPRSGGVFAAVKGWFAKPDPAAADEAHRRAATNDADRRLADLHHRQADALDRFRAGGRTVAAAGLPVPTPAGLAATAEAVARTEAEAAVAAAGAEELLARFDADRLAVLRALGRAVPVAVGPAAALADPLLAAADRVVVAAADHLDDATLSAACETAPARVLLGAAAPVRPHRNGKSGTYHRPTLFRRLWDRLAAAEVWALEGVQLVATLRAHDPADTSDEPLADRPEVELRFTRAGDLAAVAFPPTMTLAEAKGLLAAELGFVSLTPCGGHVWHDDPDRLAACWPAVDPDGGDWVDLGDGVRELVCGCGPDGLTAGVSFDRTDGWTRESAETWLADRLPSPRAVRLPAPVLVAG